MRKYENVRIEKLKPYERNARTHSEEQVEKIVASIEEFGFINPVLIDADFGIIAGHGRVLAAQKMGMEEVPCLFVEDLTEVQKRAYVIADNKLALDAGWDTETLKLELEDLNELNFDVSLTGFSLDDFDFELPKEIEEDDFEAELPEKPKSKLGEIYQLGKHRLMCGDNTKQEDVEKLMNGGKADMVFTDPPFGNNLGYGRGQLGERFILNDDNTEILEKMFDPIDTLLKNNSHCLIWIQWRTFAKLEKEFKKYKLRTVVIWDKKQAGLSGGGFAEQCEMLCVFIKGHATQCEYSGNVWSCSREHQKREDSEQLERKCYMMELDPRYIDVTINRWEEFTGKKAVKVNG